MIAAVLSVAVSISAQVFVPPAGYGGDGARRPGVAPEVATGAPALTRLSDAIMEPLFAIAPGYPRAAAARIEVVGAFAVAERPGRRVTAALGAGFPAGKPES